MLLAVNASRTLFEDLDEPIGLFDEQLLSIRNSVTANVLLQEGQSLILSGLAERERQRVENKIPSEVNVPGLSETISREFTNSVTIILTPRSVKTRNEDRDGQEPLFATDEAAAYRTLLDEYAVSVGLDPAHDIAIQRAISPPTRAVLMSPSFLYLPAAQETL
jgi:hypothetical protein